MWDYRGSAVQHRLVDWESGYLFMKLTYPHLIVWYFLRGVVVDCHKSNNGVESCHASLLHS